MRVPQVFNDMSCLAIFDLEVLKEVLSPHEMFVRMLTVHCDQNSSYEITINGHRVSDCLFIREGNNVEVKIYRRTTHTGQYIHHTSNVAPNIKASVISALSRRAKLVCTKNDYLAEEHIKKTVLYGYPKNFVKKKSKKH